MELRLTERSSYPVLRQVTRHSSQCSLANTHSPDKISSHEWERGRPAASSGVYGGQQKQRTDASATTVSTQDGPRPGALLDLSSCPREEEKLGRLQGLKVWLGHHTGHALGAGLCCTGTGRLSDSKSADSTDETERCEFWGF